MGPIMWVWYFRLWVASPCKFPCCFEQFVRVGLITLSIGIGFPIFFQILLIFSWFTLIFTKTFPVLVSFTPNFAVIVLRNTLLTPDLARFILQATCSAIMTGLALRGSAFGTQLPLKIGSLAKTFLLALSLKDSYKYQILVPVFYSRDYTPLTLCTAV